jgi:hypothetical protein
VPLVGGSIGRFKQEVKPTNKVVSLVLLAINVCYLFYIVFSLLLVLHVSHEQILGRGPHEL